MLYEDISAPITLVLHHPHFFTQDYWEGWSRLTGCNIIAFDAPHHGNNRNDQDFATFAHTTTDHAATLTDTPLIIAGVSQGGVIAQEASSHPRVVGVVGIATTRQAATPQERETMESTCRSWGEKHPPSFLADIIARNATNSQEETQLREEAFTITRQAVMAMSKAQITRSIPLLLARRAPIPLEVPSLFIHGTADQTYDIEEVQGAGEASTVIPIDGGSHSLPLQYPRLVGALLGQFARSIITTP